MAQKSFEQLLAGVCDDVRLRLVSAVLHKNSQSLDVKLIASKLLLPGHYERIKACISDAFSKCGVELKIELEDGALEKSGDELLKAWVQLMPVLGAQLNGALCSVSDTVISITVPAAAKPVFERIGTKELASYIALMASQLPIKLIYDESLVSAQDTPAEVQPKKSPEARPTKALTNKNADLVIYGKAIQKSSPLQMAKLAEDSGRVVVEGRLIDVKSRPTRGDKKLIVIFDVSDYSNTISCKVFAEKAQGEKLISALEKARADGRNIRVRGDCQPDPFSHELCLMANDIASIAANERSDKADEKRVELHLHTKLSAMDATTDIDALMKKAKKWGHKAIAVTDHGVVQAFPMAYEAAGKAGLKLILGMEGYLVPDCIPVSKDDEFVALELVATGAHPERDSILHLSALKRSDGETLDIQVAADKESEEPMAVQAGIPVSEALERLNLFAKGCHFLVYDVVTMELLWAQGKRQGVAFSQSFASLKLLCDHAIKDTERSDAVDDSAALGINMAPGTERYIAMLDALIARCALDEIPVKTRALEHEIDEKSRSNHIILLAQNHQGLRNLYKLVSYSHLEHFYRRPRIPRSLLMMYRQGLIVGSACEQGELFQAVLENENGEKVRRIAAFYDYLEIQPIANNEFMVRSGKVADRDGLRALNKKIVELGETMGKPVVATGDVHFLEPQDEAYRRIIMASQGYEDADYQAPLYFKTTDEMLEEFAYLGQEKAKCVVVDAPNMIAERCENLLPFPKDTHTPKIDEAESELRNLTMTRAHLIYGDELPQIVQARLDKELGSIIKHGFAVLYYIAYKLVSKSMSDGYIVGSRGSVGSSLVATMMGITEVNPLPPHYVCPECQHSDFEIDPRKYSCGCDLPDKDCSVCGTRLKKDGYNISFEVFLGFKGDKVPDIDLNFSGEYQARVHKYTEELFKGNGQVFKAGTISEIKDRTAYGFVRKYFEERSQFVTRAEIERLTLGCSGVKKTTGQHPGGIVVVPRDSDVFEFTPLQHPADDKESGIITTHFAFKSLHDTLVKLDILGHDDPTALKMLEDITGIKPQSIPLDDPETMKLFSSTESLGLTSEQLMSEVGTYGIPEFGTSFVRQMLVETRPTTMDELVRIAGLSHGTDVWLNNAQTLISNGTATLSEVICTRDDILKSLLLNSVEPSLAFKIMEQVRKGKGTSPEMDKVMLDAGTPEWFIDSCKKIKYMFPRAHAAAYLMMAFRIAYFKVHYPEAFYSTYFSVRSDTFDAIKCQGGLKKVTAQLKELLRKKPHELNVKQKELITILEVVMEMNLRGIELLPVDVYKSDATRFGIEGNAIRPAINALSGVGTVAAENIAATRSDGPFLSNEDFQRRAKVSSAVITTLRDAGAIEALPETDQLSMF